MVLLLYVNVIVHDDDGAVNTGVSNLICELPMFTVTEPEKQRPDTFCGVVAVIGMFLFFSHRYGDVFTVGEPQDGDDILLLLYGDCL